VAPSAGEGLFGANSAQVRDEDEEESTMRPKVNLSYHPSSRASRVRSLLEELGQPHDLQRLDFEMEDPEYLRIHPLGLVPALERDGERLFESVATLLHLADRYPEKRLAPPLGTYERALYYRWILFALTRLAPPLVEYQAETEAAAAADRGPRSLDRETAAWHEAARALEGELAAREYIVGGALTAADVLLCSLLAWAMTAGLLEGHAGLARYLKSLASRPASRGPRASDHAPGARRSDTDYVGPSL
jgi:glutathione S-transferase